MSKKIVIKKSQQDDTDPNSKDSPVEPLWVGDQIEFGVTEHVKASNGRETWVKFGVVSSVRPNESTQAAEDRVAAYVNQNIQEAVKSL